MLATFVLLLTLIGLSEPTPISVSAGFLFVAAGELLRVWAAGHLVKTERLTTSGPYRYTRNPLYLGRLAIFTGIAIMSRLPYQTHWIVLLCGYLLFFAYYLPRKERVEPTRLRLAHGAAYEAYYRAVPPLFPRRTPWKQGSNSGWHSLRMRRNREQWMVVALALITLFLLWRAYA